MYARGPSVPDPTMESMLKEHFARAQMHMPPPALSSRYTADDHHVSRYPPMTVPQPMRSPPPVLQSPQQSHTAVSPHSQHSLMPTYEEPRSVVSRFLDEIVPEPSETDQPGRSLISHTSQPHRTSQSESTIPSDIGSNIDLNEGIAVDHGDCPLPPTDGNFEKIVIEKLEKGCGCSMECYKKYPHKAVYEHILDIREMGKYERELYIMGALSELEINDLETNQRGGPRQRVRHFYMHCGEKVCRTAFMVIYDIGYAALESIRKHVRTTGVSPRVHGNLGKSHKPKDEESPTAAEKEPKKKKLKLDISMKEEVLEQHAIPCTSAENQHNGEAISVCDALLASPIPTNPAIEEQVSQVLKEIEHMEKEGINGNTIDPNPIMPELSESQKFHEKMKKGCGCKLDCLRKFPPSVIYGHILDIREMSRIEREMYVMVALSSGDEDLKELTQKGTKRLRMLHDYMHMGYKICKYTFMVIYDIGDHQLKNLQRHIASKGITPRIHASKGKKPWHAITSDDIKRACNFINNFTEIVGTPQPSAPRVGPDNQTLILLPMGTRKKDVHGRYTERCHELEVRAVKYSTFITIWKKCLKHIQIPEPDTKGRKIEPLKCKMSPDRMSLDGGMSIDGRMSVDSRMSVDGHISVDGRMSVGLDGRGLDGRMSVGLDGRGLDGRMSVGLDGRMSVHDGRMSVHDGRMSVHDGRMSVDGRLPDGRMPDRI